MLKRIWKVFSLSILFFSFLLPSEVEEEIIIEAKRIDSICKTINRRQEIYLQVNIGRDPNKQGFDPSIIEEEAKKINNMTNLKVCGIMMIPPHRKIDDIYRDYHKKTKALQETIYQNGATDFLNISMGMSRDYDIAIQEGATHIRLGSILFGERRAQC